MWRYKGSIWYTVHRRIWAFKNFWLSAAFYYDFFFMGDAGCVWISIWLTAKLSTVGQERKRSGGALYSETVIRALQAAAARKSSAIGGKWNQAIGR